ncbi:hypothetical protein [Streptomyces canus]|uniref:hypothetical protein n=1 Tax=Streptomyces canus TaxID=58343 RepID=UPI002E295618|nr:hypothetical protein [Streptomyces canus]
MRLRHIALAAGVVVGHCLLVRAGGRVVGRALLGVGDVRVSEGAGVAVVRGCAAAVGLRLRRGGEGMRLRHVGLAAGVVGLSLPARAGDRVVGRVLLGVDDARAPEAADVTVGRGRAGSSAGVGQRSDCGSGAGVSA